MTTTTIDEGAPTLETIGLIGAGAMGSAFANRLVARGYRVLVYDPSAQALANALSDGAEPAADAQAVFAAGGPVLICVSSPRALDRSIDAACAADAAGAKLGPVIETSTLPPPLKDAARQRVAAIGVTLLDCPVSGTSAQARNGDLVVFASGDERVIAACGPIFAAIARRTFNLGSFGMGMRMKLLANHLVGLHSAVAAEMMMLAGRSGLDPAVALAALADSAGASRMLQVRGPLMLDHNYRPATGSIDIIVKDGEMILDLARETGCSLPLFSQADAIYRDAQQAGWGDADIAAVFEHISATFTHG